MVTVMEPPALTHAHEQIGSAALYRGDCLEVMTGLPDGSIDMVLCDLPYGVTDCSWDTPIPLDVLWAQYARLVRADGAIVLTATQPFGAALVMSQPTWFRHDWIWKKSALGNFMKAKYRPLAEHEQVFVFSRTPPRYFPQMTDGAPFVTMAGRKPLHVRQDSGPRGDDLRVVNTGTRYPRTIQSFPFARSSKERVHPTQKPVALFAYLVRTYTAPGDLVLDNCAGSFTTAVACLDTGRRSVCIEKDEGYYASGVARVRAALSRQRQLALPLGAETSRDRGHPSFAERSSAICPI